MKPNFHPLITASALLALWLLTWIMPVHGQSITTTPLPTQTLRVGQATLVPTVEVRTVTPSADGAIIHEVQPGQALWNLAIAYQVKVDDIKRLNNLTNDLVFPGQKIVIAPSFTPTASPTETSTPLPPTNTPRPSATLRPPTATRTATSLPTATTVIFVPPLSPGSPARQILAFSIIGVSIIGLALTLWRGLRHK